MASKVKSGILVTLVLAVVALLWVTFRSEGAERGDATRFADGAVPGDGVAVVGSEGKEAPASTEIPTVPFQEPTPPARPAAMPDPYGDLRVEVVWHDGEPAADVEVRVLPWGGADPFFNETFARTDEQGEVLFRRISAGKVTLIAQLGGWCRAEVEAGVESVAKLEIPAGFKLKGTVVDGAGHPLPGATIILSRDGAMNEGRPITTSDARGRFTLDSVPTGSWRSVGARADGYTPSPMIILLAPKGETQEIRLVLDKPGGAIEGIVTDPDGRPVSDALVEIGDNEFDQFPMGDGRRGMTPGKVKVRTDAAGRFEFGGLRPGSTPVAIRARKWAPWRGVAEVAAHAKFRLEARLGLPATIRGHILKAGGEPAVRALVTAGQYGDFMGSLTRVREDGSYEMTGVEPGEVELRAELDDHGQISGTVHAAPGEVVTWDARLSVGGRIAGRVVNQSWEPLVGWNVAATGYHWARTDEDGHFEMLDCKPGEYTLKVSQSIEEEGEREVVWFPAVEVEGIRPDGDPVTIEVPDAMHATCAVEARVLAPDETPVSGVTYSLWRVGPSGSSGGRIESPDAAGLIRVAPIPPGTYRMDFRAPGYPKYRSEEHTIVVGETWDLGIVRLEQGGTLRLEFSGHVPEASRGLWASAARVSDGLRGDLERKGNRVASNPLAPGEYVLRIAGLEVAAQELRFTIRAGEETRLQVTTAPGHDMIFSFPNPPSGPLEKIQVTIRDAAGTTVYHRLAQRYRPGPLEARVGLGPGTYTVSAEADGRLVSTTVVIAPDLSGPKRVNISF